MKEITKEMGQDKRLIQNGLSVLQLNEGEVLVILNKAPFVAEMPVTVLVREFNEVTSSCQEVLQCVEGHEVWQGRAHFRDYFKAVCEKMNATTLTLSKGAMPIVSKDMFLIPANEKETSWYVIPYKTYYQM